ncbi:hypothetical protein HPB47_018195 [Ixodes persulcatus]|uniref:Uncharacterized protein n=1 Tax=Ixodes persulcatus TaxID=34615 RepID=A0AC60QQ09_IXOPE|nr:hypothetical protein HPB47_018195 [Ixodes persulcatus]
MYAETPEKLEAAIEDMQAKSHQAYITRVMSFLKCKTEWNYFCRRLLAHAYNRKPMHQLQYNRLLSRMPAPAAQAITALDTHTYQVPSGTADGKVCEVYSDVGMCTCAVGLTGDHAGEVPLRGEDGYQCDFQRGKQGRRGSRHEFGPGDCAGWLQVRIGKKNEPISSVHMARKASAKATRAARIPSILPKEETKVIPKLLIVNVISAIRTAANLSSVETALDTQCPKIPQNIMVISTPDEQRARRYANIKSIVVGSKTYEVGAYAAALHGTVEGVVKGIPPEDSAGDAAAPEDCDETMTTTDMMDIVRKFRIFLGQSATATELLHRNVDELESFVLQKPRRLRTVSTKAPQVGGGAEDGFFQVADVTTSVRGVLLRVDTP